MEKQLSPAEEFYNNSKHPPMDSKWSKNRQTFNYWDMIQFAEDFAEDQKKKTESKGKIETN